MERVIILEERNPITNLPYTDEERVKIDIYQAKKSKLIKKMTELGIDIEIKSFVNPSRTNLIHGFYSIYFEGKNCCQKGMDGHNDYYDKSEIIDVVCDYFKAISEWREENGLKICN